MSRKTEIIKLIENKYLIEKIVKTIDSGGLISFPTETVYGIGTKISNYWGINKIFKIRKRPRNKSLLILIAQKKDLNKYAKNISKSSLKLIKKFWPGPLTLIFEKKKTIPDFITANKNTIAIRLTENNFLRKLIKKIGEPIVAPSANFSGQKPAISAKEVIKNFNGSLDLILDGGKTKYQKESTILDLSNKKVKILRIGAINKKQLEKYL